VSKIALSSDEARRRLVRICSALAAGFGILALLGWVLGLHFLASFGADLYAMAPSTALMFVLYGISALLRARLPLGRGAHRIGVAVNSVGALVALLLSILSLQGIHPAIEHFGFAALGKVGQAPVGHMSPVTAIGFLLASLSFFWSLPSSRSHPWRTEAAWWTASLLIATNSLLLVAYLFGRPFFYGGSFIPVAVTASIAFVFLGTALLALAARQESTAGPPERIPYPLALVFVLLAAGIVTVGGLYVRSDERRYRAEVENELLAQAELKTNELVQWRLERLGDASVFVGNTSFATLVQRVFGNPQDTEARAQLQSWLTKVQTHYQYDRISVLDARGAERLAVPEGWAPDSSVIARRMPEILRAGEATFEDFYRNEHDQRVYLSVLVPILDDRGRALGMLAFRIDPETYIYPLLNRPPTPAQTAETLLVRREGNDVLFLNELKFQKHTTLTLRIPLANRNVAAVKAALGQEGLMEAQDYRGVSVLVALRAVPGSPWFLVTRVDTTEIDAPLRERLLLFVFLLGSMLALAAAVARGLWREQSALHLRKLYELERERGMLIEGVTDYAIFMLDSSGHVTIWNAGAERIKGYRADEIIGQHFSRFYPEEDVARGKPAKELETAAREGRFEEEGWRVRKDGSLFWANVIITALCDQTGQLRGFSKVTRDMTERKQAETTLRVSEERYRSFVLHSSEGIARIEQEVPLAVHLPLEEQTGLLLRHSYVAECNDALARMYGFASAQEMVGKRASDFLSPEDPKNIELIRHFVSSGYCTLGRESNEVDAKGISKVFLNSMTGTVENGCLVRTWVIQRDITEQRRAEEEKQKLVSAVQNSPDIIGVATPEGRVLFVNQAGQEMLGIESDAAAASSQIGDYFSPEEGARFGREVLPVILSGRSWHGEVTLKHFVTNETFPVDMRAFGILDEHGRLIGIANVSHDITERKRAEARIRYLNRVYAVLSDVNQAIVRVHEPQALFGEACRIAVEKGGFRMAWVGLLDAEGNHLRPVAHAGVTDGYLDKLPIVLGDGSGALRPAAIVLREGRYAVCNDIEHDPDASAWRADALARGYRALSSFPLTAKGKTLGTFTLYASEPEFFDAEELLLLDKMAVDLSFAMEIGQLEEGQLLLGTAVEQVSLSVIITDNEGCIEYVNPAFTEITGYTSAEVLGKNPRLWKSGKQDRALYENLWKTIAAGKVWQGELINRRKDGSLYTAEASITPVRSEHGQITRFVSIMQDVTARKQMEEDLHGSEERFRSVFEGSPLGILLVGLDGRIFQVNRSFCEMLGYSEQELIGRRPADLTHPEDAGKDAKLSGKILKGEIPHQRWEKRYLRKNGQVFFAELDVTLIRDAAGKPVYALGMIADINQRKQAQKAMSETLRFTQQILDTSPIGIVTYKASGEATGANPASAQLVGASIGQVRALNFRRLESWRQCGLLALAEEALASGGPCHGDFHLTTTFGKEIWVEARFVAFTYAEELHLLTLFEDISERKRAQESLKLFRVLVDQSNDAIQVVDLGTMRFLDVNERACSSLGYTREELLSMVVYDIDPTADESVRVKVGDELRKSGFLMFETLQRRKDGSTFPVEISMKFVQLDRNYVVCAIRDITERKQAERDLREKENLLSQSQRIAHIGSWSFDLTTQNLTWTEETYSIYGVSPDTYTPSVASLMELIHPDDRGAKQDWISAAAAGHSVGHLEFRIVRPDGSIVLLDGQGELVRGDDSRPVLLLGTVQDITERKRAEEALRQAEEKYRGIFEGAVAGIFQSDLSGRYLSANPAMARILGYDSPQELLTSVTDISGQIYVNPEDRQAFRHLIEQQGVIQNFACEVYRKDHSKIWVSVSAHAMRKDGVLIGFEGTIMDITERKTLEEQLRGAQRMEAVGRLAGGVAHDFNNVLGVIVGYSQLLEEAHAWTETQDRQVKEIRKAADRATGITRQLLAFSRKQILQPKVLNLNALTEDLGKMLRRLIGEDVELITNAGSDLGQIKADPGQIEQIILNLAINARDAMPQGGKLVIETANVDLDHNYAAMHPPVVPGPYVMLAMSDTGCGMDAETQARIFEPFFTTKELGKGTGLGLSIVYGIVKQSNGYIWVYSEPGRGTTFKIYLRRVDESPETLAPGKSKGDLPRGTETILLVEDEQAMRTMARVFLESKGYAILEARSGQEAMEIARQHGSQIHLLLTDVIMPGMSGRELAETLATSRADIKVLYMSGYTDELVTQQGILSPGLQLLEKPFTKESLLGRVRAVLDGAS
jgi:PAS domain S-box-containing protein